MAMIGAIGALAGGVAGGMLRKATETGPFARPQSPKIEWQPITGFYMAANDALAQGKAMAQSMYSQYISDAMYQQQQGFAKGNSDLVGLSRAGVESYNEYLRMTGIDPIQKTTPLESLVDAVGYQTGNSAQIKAKMQAANMEKDPTKRLAYKDEIYKLLAETPTENRMQQDLSAIPVPQQAYIPFAPTKTITDAKKLKTEGYMNAERQVTDWQSLNAMGAVINEFNKSQNLEYAREQQRVAGYWDQRTKQENDAKLALAQQWADQYSSAYDSAYTSEQLNEKIAATPGYGVALKGGSDAIQRSQAATGMLGSGNTLLALETFGQELGTTTYQNTLNNLMQGAQTGLQATSQLSQNEIAQGQYLATMAQQAGQFAAQNQLTSSQAMAQQMMSQADSLLKVAEQNALMKLKWDMDAKMNHPSVGSTPLGTQMMPTANVPQTFKL